MKRGIYRRHNGFNEPHVKSTPAARPVNLVTEKAGGENGAEGRGRAEG